eukprot:525579-Pyramimonas_sp.AAC.1
MRVRRLRWLQACLREAPRCAQLLVVVFGCSRDEDLTELEKYLSNDAKANPRCEQFCDDIRAIELFDDGA